MNSTRLEINIAHQQLTVFVDTGTDTNIRTESVQNYPIATAKNGIGQYEGSECTPLGKHRIFEKIGSELAENTVFVGRKPTGEIYDESLSKKYPERDWILTRILWLQGEEAGFNQGHTQNQETGTLVCCDTKARYIYIHGCPDTHPMKIPSSHGCIKMRNADIIQLYEHVAVGTTVQILAE